MSRGLNQKIHNFISFLDRFKNTAQKLITMNQRDAEKIQRWLDEDGKRIYENQGTGDQAYSVTTILDGPKTEEKPVSEKTQAEMTGIDYWKKNNDGIGDNADWEDILHYKTNRGTLAHYRAFNRFDHAFMEADSMWTEDEQSSLDNIQDKKDNDNYIYSIVKDKDFVNDRDAYEILKENEDYDLNDIMKNDLEYVEEEFDKICRDKHIKASNVEQVEAMFVMPGNDEHAGFGGQADLLYKDPNTGDHVVADLKTSKRIYDKHKQQIAAYAYAAEKHPKLNGHTVDRGEIIRINPDSKETEVYTVEQDELEQYWEEFADKTFKMD